MKVLIFDPYIEGHHLEYLHHLYEGAGRRPDDSFCFWVPKGFLDIRDRFSWADYPNVSICFMSDQEDALCNQSNLLRGAWSISKMLGKKVREFDADRLWLVMLMITMPFLPFFLPAKCKLTGILYRLYFYDGSMKKGFRLLLERLRYAILSHHPRVERVLVLNDKHGADELNRRYGSGRFEYLPDPVPEIDMSSVRSVREDISASSSDQIYLHFGALNERKGTLDILSALALLPSSVVEGKVFVFAGKIDPDISARFYGMVAELASKVRIVVYDEFCSYERLNNLCYTSDCILVPYHNTNQSSGVIGYAGVFGKPLVGPDSGLLGRLIKEYNLGVTISCTIANLAAAIASPLPSLVQNEYPLQHTIEEFIGIFNAN